MKHNYISLFILATIILFVTCTSTKNKYYESGVLSRTVIEIPDSNYSFDIIELFKLYNQSFTDKSISYITCDSIYEIINNNNQKYFRWFIGFGLKGVIVVENNKYEKLKLLLSNTFNKVSEDAPYDSSNKMLIISNKNKFVRYPIDLNKDYNKLLNMLQQVFDEHQLKEFHEYLERDIGY